MKGHLKSDSEAPWTHLRWLILLPNLLYQRYQGGASVYIIITLLSFTIFFPFIMTNLITNDISHLHSIQH